MAAFAEDGMEEISEEEKMAIVSQFLLSSPPGEIKEVLKDIKIICPGETLSEDVLSGVFRSYNNSMNEVINGVICDESTMVEPDHYMDFATGKVLKIDSVEQSVLDDDVETVDGPSVPSDLREMREALEDKLNEYVKSQYVKETTVANVSVKGENLVVLVSGQKLNLKNYWGGRWQSKFIVDMDSKQVEGMIKIRVHYFEDGNVQMTTDRSVDPMSISFSNAQTLASSVVEAVSNMESQVQNSLEEMYTNMSKETFKDMRRVLPITRQKMDWSGAQMQLAKGFSSSK